MLINQLRARRNGVVCERASENKQAASASVCPRRAVERWSFAVRVASWPQRDSLPAGCAIAFVGRAKIALRVDKADMMAAANSARMSNVAQHASCGRRSFLSPPPLASREQILSAPTSTSAPLYLPAQLSRSRLWRCALLRFCAPFRRQSPIRATKYDDNYATICPPTSARRRVRKFAPIKLERASG